MNVTTGQPRARWLATVGGYAVLFLLGLVEGTIGSFQFSRTAGPVPLAALVCCAAILATCLLAGWGMRSGTAALMPGIGWILATFVLSMPVSNGSVIITNTAPGKWYVYGGTVSVLIGVALALSGRIRRGGPPPRRAGDT